MIRWFLSCPPPPAQVLLGAGHRDCWMRDQAWKCQRMPEILLETLSVPESSYALPNAFDMLRRALASGQPKR